MAVRFSAQEFCDNGSKLELLSQNSDRDFAFVCSSQKSEQDFRIFFEFSESGFGIGSCFCLSELEFLLEFSGFQVRILIVISDFPESDF